MHEIGYIDNKYNENPYHKDECAHNVEKREANLPPALEICIIRITLQRPCQG